jgi:PAS domain S-box-containing protein
MPMTILDRLLQPVWEVSSEPILISTGAPDPDNRQIVYVNHAFASVNGYSSEETIGRTASILHGRETNLHAVRENEERFQGGRPQEYMVLLYRKDGSPYQCTVTSAPLVDLDGVSEFIISMYRPVPETNPMAAVGRVQRTGSVPLTLPMPLNELPVAHYPDHLTSHPELDALKELWLETCGRRTLPNRQDLDLGVMKRWASHVSVAMCMPDDGMHHGLRFRFRLFGTVLAQVYGRDLTGCFLDELTPRDLWSVIVAHYREVARTKRPLFAPISVSNGRWYTEVSRLLLPLAHSGNGEVAFIMAADYKRETLF